VIVKQQQRRRFAFLGAATLVSVGYIDPGNWATDLEGGARFGYQLIWVLVASGLIATLLQTLSARLGLVTGLDLALACRTHYPERLRVPLWLLAELAIIACDLAEVIGSAVALNLLFGLPLVAGALLTVGDVLLVLMLQRRGARSIEVLIGGLLLVIALCLGTQLFLARPSPADVVTGLVPRIDKESLYIAIGILGATVMPHNLYLHSAIVAGPNKASTVAQQKRRLSQCLSSTAFALTLALLLNASILMVSAAVFWTRGVEVSDLRQAHQLLTPLLGTGVGAVLFAIALLCSGQSSTVTGTLAGQIVMEGFVSLRLPPVLRRALTRGLAIIPAVIVLSIAGEQGAMPLLVVSQVVLSLQLPFAIVPLVRFTSSPAIMGRFANSTGVKWLATACAVLVGGANAALVSSWIADASSRLPVLGFVLGLLAGLVLLFLLWISLVPLRLRASPFEAGAPEAVGKVAAGPEPCPETALREKIVG
jgi:manganese transport protein